MVSGTGAEGEFLKGLGTFEPETDRICADWAGQLTSSGSLAGHGGVSRRRHYHAFERTTLVRYHN